MPLTCYFCNQAETDAKRIVTYRNTNICDECIQQSSDLLYQQTVHQIDEETQQKIDLDIPLRFFPTRLYFNHPTETIILEVVDHRDRYYQSLLFIRRKDEL